MAEEMLGKCLKNVNISEYKLRDCSVLLKNRRVEDKKVLKCCAHAILGMDHTIDKVICDGLETAEHISWTESILVSVTSI